MIAALFLEAGIATCAMGCAAIVRGWGARNFYGWIAIANGFMAGFNALTGGRVLACAASAVCAYAAWQWWRNGGGDGTRRRLKAWAQKFRGVRRTAPVAGGAS